METINKVPVQTSGRPRLRARAHAGQPSRGHTTPGLLLLAGGLWLWGAHAGWTTEVQRAEQPAKAAEGSGLGNIQQSWTNSLGMRFVAVAGTNLWFSVWETRVQDYAAFVGASGYEAGQSMLVMGTNGWELRAGCNWQTPGFAQSPTHPVVGVNWEDAQAFCRWLGDSERRSGRLSGSDRYRLPTDAEWSLAVGLNQEPGRTPQEKFLGIRGVFPWGTNWPPAASAGNFDPSLGADPYERTAPVGSFGGSHQGLFDLAGNVAEWCEDWWNDERKFRVLRGAAWNNDCQLCLMSSYRFPNLPTLRIDYYGFRVVLERVSAAPR